MCSCSGRSSNLIDRPRGLSIVEGLPGVGVIHGGQLHGLPERGLCMRGTIYRVGGGGERRLSMGFLLQE